MNLHERLKAIVEASTNPNRRYKELEEFSGITAATWKTYWTRGVRPSSEMIEAIGSKFPQYCEWLLTGQVHNGLQKNPTVKEEAKPAGWIDLSLLDNYEPSPDSEEEAGSKLTEGEINELVEAFFSQLVKRRRKK